MPRDGMAVGRGTGGLPEGKPISRTEKRLERAQEETRDEGDSAKEGADGREEGVIGAALR